MPTDLEPRTWRCAARRAAGVAVLVGAVTAAGCASGDPGSDTSSTTAGTGGTGTSAPGGSTTSSAADAPSTTASGTGETSPSTPRQTNDMGIDTGDGAPLDAVAPYGVGTGQACTGSTLAKGEPIPVTLAGSLNDGAPDGQLLVRVIEADDFLDLLGSVTGGTFLVEGAVPTPGEKEVIEAFIVTPGGETVDVTLAMQEFVGGSLTVATTPGLVAGSGTCP